jgi:hypothetical protein
MNKFLWKVWYKIQYFYHLGMGGATDAVTHPYKDNQPPKIGPQPYTDKPEMNKKWR